MTYHEIWQPLVAIYGEGEAKAIARYLLDVAFHISTADIYCGAVDNLNAADGQRLAAMLQRLSQGEPVQYVVGYADFCGRQFAVDPNVLIPRPETEELCQWIIGDNNSNKDILDIGTGSGCIAITLALDIAGTSVTTWDISNEALDAAINNAKRFNAIVNFEQVDALNPPCDTARWDIIVSNPPYICDKEKAAIERNVMDFEPHLALFVPDSSPLLFYQSIARYALSALRNSGALYFEINPLYARDTADMLSSFGYAKTEIRQDQFGKQRMIKAIRP